MRRFLLAGSVLAALGAGLGYQALLLYRQPGPLVRPTDVVVPHGGLAAVAEALGQGGIVAHPWTLRLFGKLTSWQGPIRAAELHFPPGASVESVLLILRHGRPVQHLLTIPEGATAARVGGILASAPMMDGEIVLPEEGFFLPESYAYERKATAVTVVQRARASMDLIVDRAWASRLPEVALRSRRELVVLASLVERETHLPAERGLVAAVFLNRLRLGMKLQSDPTVVYAVSGGGSELSHGLRRDELDMASPYNTYFGAGLPSGPICNPGAASVDAAAHPARSDALYFVADGSGGHAFARTLDEHIENVARVRRLMR